jgi:lipooligosaccharide transport system permease protein
MATSLSPSYFFFNYHFTIVVTPMLFLSGIFFPLEAHGSAFRWFTWFLPLTHAVDGARALNRGALLPTVPGAMAWLAVASALLIPVAVRMIRRRLIK